MQENLLLSVLPPGERARIEKHCETVMLRPRATLCEADAIPEYAWFPHSVVCSSLVHVQNGDSVEVALVGREGMAGLAMVLDSSANPFHVIVQYPGQATRIPRQAFLDLLLDPGRPFCTALLKYANLYLTTVAQSAACSRLHRIEQRLARWLLDFSDRASSSVLPVTHELLAVMVGAYRPSVTNALAALEERRIVALGRGQIEILDQEALMQQSCECHQAIQRRIERTLEQIRAMAA
jgi:CRP-like cAMP-binding protein